MTKAHGANRGLFARFKELQISVCRYDASVTVGRPALRPPQRFLTLMGKILHWYIIVAPKL
jgi:hypothetical protein